VETTTTTGPAPEATEYTDIARNTTPMDADIAASIDDAFNDVLADNPDDLTGIWIGVWHAENGEHIAAYGNAEKGGAASTLDDHSRIGSITKTFTATCALQLVEVGALALEDTIADVLPDLADSYPDIADITVEQLLGMTSGIPDYANTGLVLGDVVTDPARVWTADEIIDLVLTTLPLDPPGTLGYSSTNYLILGEMLEKIEGVPIEAILTSVATAAGLTGTALTPGTDHAMPAPFSHGYLDQPGVDQLEELGVEGATPQDVTDWSVSYGGAAGAMYSTIADMGAWTAGGMGTSLLTTDTAAQRPESTPYPGGGSGGYGLGIDDFGLGWIGHSGQIFGWTSLAMYDTDTGDTLVVITNSTGSFDATGGPVAEIFPELKQVFG
jgi:D-alanyl-D-alanine carboxypeptidase